MIKILWLRCNDMKCDIRPFSVTSEELKEADGYIRCEYCNDICSVTIPPEWSKNKASYQIGDMVRIEERYDSWLGIITKKLEGGLLDLEVQPIGRQCTPMYVQSSSRLVEKVESLDG